MLTRSIPNTFQFNQGNLQDYLECKRRFYLKHVSRLPWPGITSEPIQEQEAHIRKGEIFHRLAHQYFLGIPIDYLGVVAINEGIDDWWTSFLDYVRNNLTPVAHFIPEKYILTKIHGYLMAARYDLLVIQENSIHIIDWKTSNRPYSRIIAQQRMQSRVYPLVLCQNNLPETLNEKIQPDIVSMTYWYSQFPDQSIKIPYHSEKLNEDLLFLTNLIHEITEQQIDTFSMTENKNRCQFCLYRSLCDRGIQAGKLENGKELFNDDDPDEQLFSLDFDAVPEIEF